MRHELTPEQKRMERAFKAAKASGDPTCIHCGVMANDVIPVGYSAGYRFWSCLDCLWKRLVAKIT